MLTFKYFLKCPIFFLALLPAMVLAVTVSDLNSAMVPVDNLSSQARRAALTAALEQSLIKISGNPQVMSIPALRNLGKSDKAQLIQSYQYIKDSNDSASPLSLQVTFDDVGLRQLLQKLKQAIWPKNRPRVLLYLATQYGAADGKASILSSSDENDTAIAQRTLLTQIAQERGLPILFPRINLEDTSHLNDDLSKALDPATSTELMQRYDTPILLAGTMQADASQKWVGKWLLLIRDAAFPSRWQYAAETQAVLLQQALNEAANLIADQYAIVDDQALHVAVHLKVSHVMDLDDYSNVLKKLRNLSPVISSRVLKISGSDLFLKVVTIGGDPALLKALLAEDSFSSVLSNLATTDNRQQGHSSNEESNRIDLQCRWNREAVSPDFSAASAELGGEG